MCTYCQSVGRTTGTACVYLLSVSGENYWYSLCVLIVSRWGELLVQPVCTYCQSVGRTTGTACVYLLSVGGENYWYSLCVLIVSRWENYWYSLCVLIVSRWGELLVQPVCTYCQSVGRTTGTACVYLLSVSR